MPINDRQTATVDKNTDSGKAGRIIIKTPSMDGDQYPLPIEAVMPAGLIAHPHPGDTVEIELPAGEDIVEHPQEAKYFGKRWDDSNDYPSKFKTNYPDRRGFYTPGGHYLIFDDKAKTITIESLGGLEIQLHDTSGQVRLGSSSASISVVLGETFNTEHATMLGLFSPYFGLIGAAFTAMVADPFLAAGLATVTKTAMTAAGTGGSGTVTAGITAFLGKAATWLSQVVKTK